MQTAPLPVELEKDKKYYWCSCGLSGKEPFCDGTHKTSETGKKSVHFEVEQSKKYYLCGCKQTKNPPFCDGSHSAI